MGPFQIRGGVKQMQRGKAVTVLKLASWYHGDMQEQQHTVIQQCWPSASEACHAVQHRTALPQRGLPLANSGLQLKAQQSPGCAHQ